MEHNGEIIADNSELNKDSACLPFVHKSTYTTKKFIMLLFHLSVCRLVLCLAAYNVRENFDTVLSGDAFPCCLYCATQSSPLTLFFSF